MQERRQLDQRAPEAEEAVEPEPPVAAPTQRYTSQGAAPPFMPFTANAMTQPSASERAYGDQPKDFSAAEEYNRTHVVDVVRFDRATHGAFARGDGQLDARRIAQWQRKHHLPEDGMVTENTCLVAEGKPPLPPSSEPYVGPPGLVIRQPTGMTFAAGSRVPVTVMVMGPPGPAKLHVEVVGQMGVERDVPITIGTSGDATLDVPLDPWSLPGSYEVAVTGTFGDTTVETRVPFMLRQTSLHENKLGPEPPLPDPTPARPPIDQARAEQLNRDNPRNVVRFDRATHGYFAKPNGELDALAVAEWQTEHNLAHTGIVDDLTCKTAESEHGGLDPGPDPRWPGVAEHGAPDIDILMPASLDVLDPFTTLLIEVRTGANMPVELDWAIVVGDLVVDLDQKTTTTDMNGRAFLTGSLNTGPSLDGTPRSATLQLEVSSPLGASELIERQTILQPRR